MQTGKLNATHVERKDILPVTVLKREKEITTEIRTLSATSAMRQATLPATVLVRLFFT